MRNSLFAKGIIFAFALFLSLPSCQEPKPTVEGKEEAEANSQEKKSESTSAVDATAEQQESEPPPLERTFAEKANPKPLQWDWSVSLETGVVGAALDVALDKDSNVYVTGRYGGTIGSGANKVSGKGSSDIYVAKLDKEGKLIWLTSAGGTGDDRGFGIEVGQDGSVYLVGRFEATGIFGPVTLTSKGGRDSFVAKLSSEGKFVWVVHIGSKQEVRVEEIGIDLRGNSYVTGRFTSEAQFGTIDLATNGQNTFVAKVSNQGKFEWAVAPKSQGEQGGRGMAVDPQGKTLVITGAFYNKATFGKTVLSSAGMQDAYVAKLDSQGSFLWAVSAGGAKQDTAFEIAMAKDGNIYVSGGYEGEANFGKTKLESAGVSDIFASKLDPKGQFVWTSSTKGKEDGISYGIAVSKSGFIYLTGIFSGTTMFGSQSVTSNGGFDMFVARLYADDGKFHSAVIAGADTNDIGSSLAVSESGVYFTGYFGGKVKFGGNTLNSPNDTSGMVIARLK